MRNQWFGNAKAADDVSESAGWWIENYWRTNRRALAREKKADAIAEEKQQRKDA